MVTMQLLLLIFIVIVSLFVPFVKPAPQQQQQQQYVTVPLRSHQKSHTTGKWIALHTSYPNSEHYAAADLPNCFKLANPEPMAMHWYMWLMSTPSEREADSSASATAASPIQPPIICVHPSNPLAANYNTTHIASTIEIVEPDYDAYLTGCQQSPPWNLQRLKTASPKYDISYGYDDLKSSDQQATVYVVDTYIDIDHPEFEGRASRGFANVPEGTQALHGTHVAGTIISKSFGVAKQSRVIEVRVLDDQGYSPYSKILEGIAWVSKHASEHFTLGTRIINMSIGGPRSEVVNRAVNALYRQGIIPIIAAGNENSNACDTSPASAINAITVASSSSEDKQSSFSNWGSCVDIYAPGESIVSVMRGQPGQAVYMSGTSMAAPHVAGVAALYLQMQAGNRYDTPSQVYKYLVNLSSVKNVIKNPSPQTPNKLLHYEPGNAQCGYLYGNSAESSQLCATAINALESITPSSIMANAPQFLHPSSPGVGWWGIQN